MTAISKTRVQSKSHLTRSLKMNFYLSILPLSSSPIDLTRSLKQQVRDQLPVAMPITCMMSSLLRQHLLLPLAPSQAVSHCRTLFIQLQIHRVLGAPELLPTQLVLVARPRGCGAERGPLTSQGPNNDSSRKIHLDHRPLII